MKHFIVYQNGKKEYDIEAQDEEDLINEILDLYCIEFEEKRK